MIVIVFALTINSSFAQFRLIKPLKSDILKSGTEVEFQWGGADVYNVGIFVSGDEGFSWDTIAVGITGQSYKWRIPWAENLNMKFRIINNYSIPPYLYYELNKVHDSEIRSVKFAPGNDVFLTCSGSAELATWDLGKTVPLNNLSLAGEISIAYDAVFCGSSDSVLVAGDGAVVLILPNTGTIRKFTDDSIKNIVRSVAYNPVEGIFAAASNTGPGIDDGIVALYDIETGGRIADFRADNLSQIRDVSFSEDGKLLCFGSYNGKIYVYGLKSKNLFAVLGSHGDNGKSSLVYSSNFDSNSGIIVSGGGDQTVRLWDTARQSLLKVMNNHKSQVWETVFHPQRNWILSASLDSMLIQWDAITGEILHMPLNHGGEVLTADYSPDGTYFISGGRDNSAKIWRNFEFISDTLDIEPVIKYPAYLKLTNVAGFSGEWRGLRLELEIPDSVPESRVAGLEIEYEVVYPSLMVNIPDIRLSHQIGIPFDTLRGKSDVKKGKNKLFSKTIQLLLSDMSFDSTRFAGYKLNTDIFAISSVNGLVSVYKECIGDTGRSFYMGSHAGVMLSPNPAKDLVRLALSMPETGNAVISIHDLSGRVVKSIGVIIDRNLDKELDIDLKELQNGNYYIFIQSNNMILSRQLKIFR